MKDLISLHDLTAQQVEDLLKLGLKLKKELKSGIPHPILKGKTLGMIFTKSSTSWTLLISMLIGAAKRNSMRL